jgi:SNF2 family DNA or RNA helicase
MKFIPHKYQEYAIQKALEIPKIGLLLDMGLGKTVCTLTVIDELIYNLFEITRVLVIAPKRVAEDTWTREVYKWDHTKHLKVSKVLGSEKDRIKALNDKADLYVINRENTQWLVDYYRNKWDFDTVVIDELSSFKSHTSKRFKALKKVSPLITRLIGLTGTPAPKSLLDMWSQVYLLDQGQRLGKTITAYKDRYFEPDKRNGFTIFNWRLKDGAESRIHEKLKDICISLSAKDYLNMPELIMNIINVKLNDTDMKKYKQLEKEKILALGDVDITAASAGVLVNKLLQLSNGAIYDEQKNVINTHNAKIEALRELVELTNGKSILVFYNFKHDLEKLKNSFKDLNFRCLETTKDIEDWNNGKIEMLFVHPASAGHGLNLQDGGNTIVWYGLTWSLELYQQANARLYRQGQQRSVIVHHLVAEGTVDVDVMKSLSNKELGQNALLEAVKARIEEYKEVTNHA